ncbi:uncharacterized mitochondrial protein AtMg00810-like [Juglans microcarpa x Juglans regia]|uniref:uncharacterized mitochondrial protein AtMg00810-like n=1 Tax=Juglans microcarpa x Juglans regia TaxID=2249226 RepID=UPI001B7E185B|nr:uncharacterized mitochondrial protein AtMg00810-like [Juglans microcarpa x Juglans regia]
MIGELDALSKNHTLDLVDLPPRKYVIGCKWIYKIKTRSDSSIERYKAQLVAKGFTQKYDIDYEETFAPLASLSSICTLMLVGSSVYFTITGLEISHTMHEVTQFMSAFRTTHYTAVLYILRYLKGTLFHGLHFFTQSPLVLRAYSGADWAGDPTDHCSTISYNFLLGSSLISWRSKKQIVVSQSSLKPSIVPW